MHAISHTEPFLFGPFKLYRVTDRLSLLAGAMSAGLVAVKRGGATAPREVGTSDRYQDIVDGDRPMLL